MRFSITTLILSACVAVNALNEGVPWPQSQRCFSLATNAANCFISNHALVNFNACACSNTGNWLQSTSQCIASADPTHFIEVYNILTTKCAETNNAIAFTLAQWNRAGGRA
ncbi:hypothetical protein E2P81_ATG06263 [Venturia nashicola]|nr:hypothetical protein E2P81_ATG06263 [Venturia nashicola]